MRVNMKIGAIALALVMALSASVMWVMPSFAQQEGETADTHVTLREEVHQAGLEAAARLLGMTADELSDQLWGGKTLADLAEEANVPLSDVRTAWEEATTAARQERIKAFIAEQVAEGRISQEQADWLNEGIDNQWFGPIHRFGRGFGGFGHEGGPGRGFGRMRMHGPMSGMGE